MIDRTVGRMWIAVGLAFASAACSGGGERGPDSGIPSDSATPTDAAPQALCGDGTCAASEDCGVCPEDCSECSCGDGACAPEECGVCAADCSEDCACLHEVCVAGGALSAGCSPCTASVCRLEPECCADMWDGYCVNQAMRACCSDCSASCGDGWCHRWLGENENSCPLDCAATVGCGDELCDASEDCYSCPEDCGFCGCGFGECGDGTCDFSECSVCPEDCPAGCRCPHTEYEIGPPLNYGCSECAGMVCDVDEYCCIADWDAQCVSEAAIVCAA